MQREEIAQKLPQEIIGLIIKQLDPIQDIQYLGNWASTNKRNLQAVNDHLRSFLNNTYVKESSVPSPLDCFRKPSLYFAFFPPDLLIQHPYFADTYQSMQTKLDENTLYFTTEMNLQSRILSIVWSPFKDTLLTQINAVYILEVIAIAYESLAGYMLKEDRACKQTLFTNSYALVSIAIAHQSLAGYMLKEDQTCQQKLLTSPYALVGIAVAQESLAMYMLKDYPACKQTLLKNPYTLISIAVAHESLARYMLKEDRACKQTLLKNPYTLVSIAVAHESLTEYMLEDSECKQALLKDLDYVYHIAIAHVSFTRFILEQQDQEISDVFFSSQKIKGYLHDIGKAHPELEAICQAISTEREKELHLFNPFSIKH